MESNTNKQLSIVWFQSETFYYCKVLYGVLYGLLLSGRGCSQN